MKVTRTGMTHVIAQAYAAYKRNGPVEETISAAAGSLVMGDNPSNNWLTDDKGHRRLAETAASNSEEATTTKPTPGFGALNLPRKGGTDILV